jgi:hypothetical protein|tara:strand:+ start:3288 stop:4334 length:1047 start_codon:yes stop_codon:yes gene_type:complete
MEDSDISSNAAEALSKMRRERINWVNGNRPISIKSETLDSATDSMKAELNKALSDTTARMENVRQVIAEAQNERIEQDLRRISEDMVEMNEEQISEFESRALRAEERHQRMDMESRLAHEERRIRDRLDVDRRRRSDLLALRTRERISSDIEVEYEERLDALRKRIEMEHELELERLERRLENELSNALSNSVRIRLDAKRIELQAEMAERLRSYRINREAEITNRIEKQRAKIEAENKEAISIRLTSIEAAATSEIDGDLEAWFTAENEAMKKIATMRRRETLLSAWADLERRLEINRAQRVSDLKSRLRSFADQDIEAPDVESIERELLKEWDRIVESAASSIVDG